MVIGYFVIAFILYFFMYKKYMPGVIEKTKDDYLADWADCKEFWIMILVPAFWIVAIPMYLSWIFLDKVYNKYFNNNKDNDGMPKT